VTNEPSSKTPQNASRESLRFNFLKTVFESSQKKLKKLYFSMDAPLRRRDRACTRLLMACALAKIENPKVDIRKPYTEIGTADSFSGRTMMSTMLARLLKSIAFHSMQRLLFLRLLFET
jgi:hypothetical protein